MLKYAECGLLRPYARLSMRYSAKNTKSDLGRATSQWIRVCPYRYHTINARKQATLHLRSHIHAGTRTRAN